MSGRSGLIDIGQSMIIVDPREFPMGLGQTPREDYPNESVGVLLYDGKNILPTPFGYKSFFDQSTRFNVGNLVGKKVQQVIAYQTSTLVQLLIALCEDGLYVANATAGESTNFTRIVDLSAGEVANVRRMWTVAVVSNRVLVYQQGQPKFWAFVNPAAYAEAATPSPISGATRTQVWTAWGCGLVSYVPTFINMAGQIGLFRADNRLGFWDSDGAVAWSSATYIEDFKPSAQTFAGVTKFSDVLGNIVKVVGQADGFVIYATRSIVRATGLPGSPEKWTGSAITSELGVAFDTQIAVSQPDDTHFCLTSTGLLLIQANKSQYVATEVIDFLAKHNKLLALTMVEGRYLFIHWADEFPGSTYTVSATSQDGDGNAYLLPAPVYPPVGSTDWWNSQVNGSNGGTQNNFDEFSGIPGVEQPTTEPLVPCFDIKYFDSSWVGVVFSPIRDISGYIPSQLAATGYTISDGVYWEPAIGLELPTFGLSSEIFDKAGQDLIDVITTGMSKWDEHSTFQTAWQTQFNTPITIDLPAPSIPNLGPSALVATYTDHSVGTRDYFNHLDLANLKIDANECQTNLYFDRYTTMKIAAKFNGTETYVPAVVIAGYEFGGWTGLTGSIGVVGEIASKSSDLLYTDYVTDALLTEFRNTLVPYDVFTEIPASAFTVANLTKRPSNASYNWDVASGYIKWLLSWNPSVVKSVFGYITEADIAKLAAVCTALGNSRTAWVGISVGFSDLGQAVNDLSSFCITPYTNVSARAMQGWRDLYVGSLIQLGNMDVDVVTITRNLGNNTVIASKRSGVLKGVSSSGSNYKALALTEPGTDSWPYGSYTTVYPSGSAPAWTYGTYISASSTMGLEMIAVLNNPPATVSGHSISIGTEEPNWTQFTANTALTNGGFVDSNSTKKLQLSGTITFEVTLEHEASVTKTPLMEMELSGWGYTPKGMSIFRKTHSRKIGTSCPMPSSALSTNLPDTEALDPTIPDTPAPPTVNPPYQWDYPTVLPFDPAYALYQKGSLAPYYPLYKGAVIYDSLLQKFGKYDSQHYLVYPLMPINRADEVVVPVADNGMFAGALDSDKYCAMFKPNSPQAMATWGKLGYYRLGMTKCYEVRAYFSEPAYGTLIIEASLDGTNINPNYSLAVNLDGQTNAILPFTAVAKWFNIRVEGRFNITTLQVIAEAKSRR